MSERTSKDLKRYELTDRDKQLLLMLSWCRYLTTEQVLDIGPEATADRIRERVGEATAFISFDIDVVDPAFAPGTGTPEPGGLSAHDALAIVRRLTGIDFVGFDVVEVIPAYDPAGQTAFLAANLAYEMLSLVAVRRAAS